MDQKSFKTWKVKKPPTQVISLDFKLDYTEDELDIVVRKTYGYYKDSDGSKTELSGNILWKVFTCTLKKTGDILRIRHSPKKLSFREVLREQNRVEWFNKIPVPEA